MLSVPWWSGKSKAQKNRTVNKIKPRHQGSLETGVVRGNILFSGDRMVPHSSRSGRGNLQYKNGCGIDGNPAGVMHRSADLVTSARARECFQSLFEPESFCRILLASSRNGLTRNPSSDRTEKSGPRSRREPFFVKRPAVVGARTAGCET
jgi:hypothetical protein